MALLSKAELLFRFEDAIRNSGWTWQTRSKNTHPALYDMFQGDRREHIKVYVWNITPGGNTRPKGEYRIQPTGVVKFDIEDGYKCFVLGWREDIAVFGAWDVRKHLQTLGKSPSMQISEQALYQAVSSGFAPYFNARHETAIAFRSDFIGSYIDFFETIHDFGIIPEEAGLLTRLSDNPYDVTDSEIEIISGPRKYVVVSTKRALRAMDFSSRVLSAYGHKCAMCGLQLRLVDGAHILPASHPDSNDATSNGVALCSLHHRAYDYGLVTFDCEAKIHLNPSRIEELKAEDRSAGLTRFRTMLRPIIVLPPDKRDVPKKEFVIQANLLRGWRF